VFACIDGQFVIKLTIHRGTVYLENSPLSTDYKLVGKIRSSRKYC